MKFSGETIILDKRDYDYSGRLTYLIVCFLAKTINNIKNNSDNYIYNHSSKYIFITTNKD